MNDQRANIFVLGIGSPHGDDQIGWRVIDRLTNAKFAGVACRKLKTPFEILDFIDAASAIYLVDSAIGLPTGQLTWKLRCSEAADRQTISEVQAHGTHDLGIDMTLRLANSLGKGIDHITLWLAAADGFAPLTDLSETATRSIAACAEEIIQELCSA